MVLRPRKKNKRGAKNRERPTFCTRCLMCPAKRSPVPQKEETCYEQMLFPFIISDRNRPARSAASDTRGPTSSARRHFASRRVPSGPSRLCRGGIDEGRRSALA